MRPSRIIVGEVRAEECLDLLLALNAGLPGMCTIHANSARESLVKMCTLPLLAGDNSQMGGGKTYRQGCGGDGHHLRPRESRSSRPGDKRGCSDRRVPSLGGSSRSQRRARDPECTRLLRRGAAKWRGRRNQQCDDSNDQRGSARLRGRRPLRRGRAGGRGPLAGRRRRGANTTHREPLNLTWLKLLACMS